MVAGVTTLIPTLRVSSPDDLLAAVPVLLGFHPEQSVVVAHLHGGRFGCVARADLADMLRPGVPRAVLAALRAEADRDGGSLVIVAYGNEPTASRQAAERVEQELGVPVTTSIVVAGDRWWFTDDPQGAGSLHDPRGSRVAAEAAFAGRTVLPTRGDVARLFLPARGQRRVAARTLGTALQTVALLPDGEAQVMLREAIDEFAAASPPRLSGRDCALLVALADHPRGRLAFWERLSPETAPMLVEMWLQVSRRFHPEQSVVASCLVGFAAWQTGAGALMTLALDRAESGGGTGEVVDLLRTIYAGAVPPGDLELARGLGLFEPDRLAS